MLTRLLALLGGLIILVWTTQNQAMTATIQTNFVVYGDIPYRVDLGEGRTDEDILKEEIAPKIRERKDIPFVIHVGDLGRPQDACSDEWLEKTQEFWKTDLNKPVFYTPGDNEWTDCDRPNLATPQSELQRLEAIRRIFFSQPQTLDPQWQYETQSELPENALWSYNGLLFVTEHLVSTDNGRTEILLDDPQIAIALVDQRDQFNKIWLDYAFEKANNQNIKAVVIATQLDPFGAADGVNDAFTRCINNTSYQGFCTQLQTLTTNFNKPVLLVHGDTNAYCFDQPFSSTITPNLWRLNAPGDFKVIDAAVISFNHSNTNKPFQVTGLLSGQTPPQECDYR